jgi:DNA repair protein REV1
MSGLAEQDKSKEPGSSPPASSFPISSPSFWNEAADVVDATIASGNRPLDEVPKIPAKPIKKARFASPSPQPSDAGPDSSPPLREVTKIEDDDEFEDHMDGKGKEVDDGRSRLSFLPNRLDPHLFDAQNAYLASAEYAPNKFGDIGDYMRKKEIKVQTQNRDIALSSAAPDLPQIFIGQSFWINGNTHPPMEELRKMILQRGGEVRPKLWNKGYVKYIIAPQLTMRKFDEFKNYKVVKEGWIVESCKEGKMLDWRKWKLQVAGGWEETGRKGLEGFLRGEPSQRASAKVESESEEEEEFEERIEDVKGIKEDGSEQLPIPQHTPVATRSLIPQTPKIPISPNHVKAASPSREVVAPKVHKPEGAWENYYTKDSNEHATEALRNTEWRLRNTAERGNEGGFIDGYYQNSRYVLRYDQEILGSTLIPQTASPIDMESRAEGTGSGRSTTIRSQRPIHPIPSRTIFPLDG